VANRILSANYHGFIALQSSPCFNAAGPLNLMERRQILIRMINVSFWNLQIWRWLSLLESSEGSCWPFWTLCSSSGYTRYCFVYLTSSLHVINFILPSHNLHSDRTVSIRMLAHLFSPCMSVPQICHANWVLWSFLCSSEYQSSPLCSCIELLIIKTTFNPHSNFVYLLKFYSALSYSNTNLLTKGVSMYFMSFQCTGLFEMIVGF